MRLNHRQVEFYFLNAGHFFDHFLILIFATVAMALANDRQVAMAFTQTDWNISYADLIPLSAAGFFAFGAFSIPAGWLADKWSRPGMMAVFFLGAGITTMIAASAQSLWQMAAAIFFIGMMGAIYHPVGLSMVVQGRARTGIPVALNGVFGNLGVAAAPLVTLLTIEQYGWRAAFFIPGVFCLAIGLAYIIYLRSAANHAAVNAGKEKAKKTSQIPTLDLDRATLIRVFAIIFFTAMIGGFIFQSTTFALPKIFDERLAGLAATGKSIGWWSFAVLTIASVAQLAVGYLVDKCSLRLVFAIIAGIQAILFAAMLNLTGSAALIVSIGFMLAVFGQIPINDVLIGRIAKSQWRSRAYGVRYIISFAVMAMTVPAIAALHQGWGFSALFIVMAFGASLIFLAVLFLPHKKLQTATLTAPAE